MRKNKWQDRANHMEHLLACVGECIDADPVLRHRMPYHLKEALAYAQREYKARLEKERVR